MPTNLWIALAVVPRSLPVVVSTMTSITGNSFLTWRDRRSSARLPDLYRVVVAARSNARAVRRPGDGKDEGMMVSVDKQAVAGGGVPDLSAVVACRNRARAIRRPGNPTEEIRVA